MVFSGFVCRPECPPNFVAAGGDGNLAGPLRAKIMKQSECKHSESTHCMIVIEGNSLLYVTSLESETPSRVSSR